MFEYLIKLCIFTYSPRRPVQRQIVRDFNDAPISVGSQSTLTMIVRSNWFQRAYLDLYHDAHREWTKSMRVVMSGMALTSECNHEPFLFRLMSDPKFSKLVLYSIDTGIDYNHSSLGGGFGKGFKVNEGFDFVGDAFTGKDILLT